MFQLSHSHHLAPSIVGFFNLHNNTNIFSMVLHISTYIPTLKKTSLLESNEFFPIGFPFLLVYFTNKFFLYKHHTICNTKFAFGKTKSIHGCTWRVHKYKMIIWSKALLAFTSFYMNHIWSVAPTISLGCLSPPWELVCSFSHSY
jgi:hypothetical protein